MKPSFAVRGTWWLAREVLSRVIQSLVFNAGDDLFFSKKNPIVIVRLFRVLEKTGVRIARLFSVLENEAFHSQCLVVTIPERQPLESTEGAGAPVPQAFAAPPVTPQVANTSRATTQSGDRETRDRRLDRGLPHRPTREISPTALEDSMFDSQDLTSFVVIENLFFHSSDST